ncbi:expressed unknown protein [Seminavis robusta]|uniref:Uncharacterized protein n=1 Tax=Seminavis robusta TaxID=568900 RepID=A0A9N8EWH3_9STRA|nr:expressed unknown protein [Seminavis robusta]|eukprot:Sro2505_g329651.1  (124) ;mRNA; r:3216-3587
MFATWCFAFVDRVSNGKSKGGKMDGWMVNAQSERAWLLRDRASQQQQAPKPKNSLLHCHARLRYGSSFGSQYESPSPLSYGTSMQIERADMHRMERNRKLHAEPGLWKLSCFKRNTRYGSKIS